MGLPTVLLTGERYLNHLISNNKFTDMEAYYYQIKRKSDDEIVDEGIIRNAEDVIDPFENSGIEELRYQVEAHHFFSPNYVLIGWPFEIGRNIAMEFRSGLTYRSDNN